MVGAADAPKEKTAGVRHVRMDLEKKETTRYIAAGGFDAVLFFFACQCEVIRLLENELPDLNTVWIGSGGRTASLQGRRGAGLGSPA